MEHELITPKLYSGSLSAHRLRLMDAGLSQRALDSSLFSQEPNQYASGEEGKSTPNIRDQVVTDAGLAASAKKKRNKLGYHRTSKACEHCRRRKIRCIPRPVKCASCARLNRDCNFDPVDQHPQPESNGQHGGRGLGRASSSASPTDQMGLPLETQNGLSYMAMSPYLGSSDIKRLKDDGFASENRGLLFGAQIEYSKGPASKKLLSSAYPIFPQTLSLSPLQNWPPGAVDPGAGDDHWKIPQRPFSFGHLENLPQQAPNQTSPPGIIAGDPNSIVVSGSIIGSHISDPWQLPSSSAPQPWQLTPQNGYVKTSDAPAAEAFNSWYPNNPNISLTAQAGCDNMVYHSFHYNDTVQSRCQQ